MPGGENGGWSEAKMIPSAWRMISNEKTRFVITVGGVGFTVILMLFQLGVYQGVKKGAVGYVQGSPAEIWVCETNSTNLIRSSSFLRLSLSERIERVSGVGETTGILRVFTTAKVSGKSITLFLFGYDPRSELAAPFPIVRGSHQIEPGEIIVDKAFAMKYRLTLGDSMEIKGRSFRVSGLCEGTNTIVIQFVFTTLEEAQRLLGFSDVVSFLLLTGNGQAETPELIQSLKQTFPQLAVFSKQEFIQNNIDELKSGVLPVFWIVALFAEILGVAIITLMLYGSVLEKRESFALLKALGASQKFLVSLVVRQSVLGALAGFLVGLFFYGLITPLIVKLVPEIALGLTWTAVGAVFLSSLMIGTFGSLIPVRKMAHIFPMEVFRQ